MYRVKATSSQVCPCCNTENETIHHVLKCQAREINAKREFVKEVKKIMKGDLQDELIIMQKIFDTIVEQSNKLGEKVIMAKQESIGWDRLLRDFYSTEWEEHLSKNDSDKKLRENIEGNHQYNADPVVKMLDTAKHVH